MNRIAAALAALSLTAAPAAARQSAIEPAPETTGGSELRSGATYWIVPALVLVALLIAILAGEEDADPPKSP
jgi:hypothetical protein